MKTNTDTPKAQERGQNCAHTPGEWELSKRFSSSENDKGFQVWSRRDDDEDSPMTWIADVSPVIDNDRGDASEQGKANARLIAAAPCLLEACDAPALDRAHDSLSALLESDKTTFAQLQASAVMMCFVLNTHHEARKAAIRKATEQ